MQHKDMLVATLARLTGQPLEDLQQLTIEAITAEINRFLEGMKCTP